MYNKYYINLARSPDRKQFMEKMYDNIMRIEAYDGKTLDKYNNIILPKKCGQNNSQLACSLSHIKAISYAYKFTDKDALILEDDTSKKYESKWNKSLDEIIKNIPADCECLSLFCSNIYSIKFMHERNVEYYRWNKLNWSTGCYYINRKGMKKIYDLFYKNGKIDLSIPLCNYVADEGVLYNNLITYSYAKPLFINNMSNSTIDHKPGLEQRLHNYIKNYFENNSLNLLALNTFALKFT